MQPIYPLSEILNNLEIFDMHLFPYAPLILHQSSISVKPLRNK